MDILHKSIVSIFYTQQTWKSLKILVMEIVGHHIYPWKEGSRWRRPSIIHDDVVLYIRREPLISQEGFSDYAQSYAILKLLLLIHCLSKSKTYHFMDKDFHLWICYLSSNQLKSSYSPTIVYFSQEEQKIKGVLPFWPLARDWCKKN